MNLADELQKLEELHRAGTLTDVEYESAKAALIAKASETLPPPPPTPPPPPPPPSQPTTVNAGESDEVRKHQVNEWATWIHVAIFAGYVLPVLGFVLPIALWQIKKDEFPEIIPHGKAVTNWVISHFIYFVLSALLILCCVGILLIKALAIISIIYPIIGALKANKGEVWNYPGSIPFFR